MWNLVATFALPVPLVLLVLLNLPLPKPFKRGVYAFVSRAVEIPMVGSFKALHVMLFFLFFASASALKTLYQHKANHIDNPFATPKFELAYLSKRWRCERNVWLSAYAFSMWIVLATFLRELGCRLKLEERLVAFEMSGYTMTVDETTREPSVSREVTSKKLKSPRSPSESPAKPHPAKPADAGEPSKVRLPTPPVPSPVIAEIEITDTFVKKDQ